MKYVLGKAGKRIGMLGRIRKNLTVHCANTIYVIHPASFGLLLFRV